MCAWRGNDSDPLAPRGPILSPSPALALTLVGLAPMGIEPGTLRSRQEGLVGFTPLHLPLGHVHTWWSGVQTCP